MKFNRGKDKNAKRERPLTFAGFCASATCFVMLLLLLFPMLNGQNGPENGLPASLLCTVRPCTVMSSHWSESLELSR